MASVKNFKKEINNVLSDIIEECYVCQLKSDDKVAAKAEKIIDEAIDTFDGLIEKLNKKGVENLKKHFNSLNQELRTKEVKLLEKLEKLKA
jgi:glutamyl-tRNA reductase